MLKIGCCGFAGARRRYWGAFPLVEVQKTFYQPPRIGTLEKWRGEAPEGFEFTLKAWQPVTHAASSPTWRRLKHPPGKPEEAGGFRPTGAVNSAWETTLACARALEATTVVFQCPASFEPTDENVGNLRRFFREAERGGLRCVWEPRGDWSEDLIRELCEALDLIHCTDPLKARPLTDGPAYFRLHGLKGYSYEHTDNDLKRLLEAAAEFETAYVLFNNKAMREDAARFRDLAEAEGVETP